MKNNSVTIYSVQLDKTTEEKIRKRDAELKMSARNDAIHFAKNNQPNLNEDSLIHFIGDFKAGYEQLIADVLHSLQPSANFPEAKADAEYFKDKDAKLDSAITDLKNQNHNSEYELKNSDPGMVYKRIVWAFISTFIIMIGDTVFNTKSFQVTGESLLFSLMLSICFSFVVFVFSHIAPFLYKKAETTLQRRLVIAISLITVTIVFTGLALLRSRYLASHDVNINPFYFVIINLFFFIVSSLLSFFILPDWNEIKHNALLIKIYLAVRRRNKEIEQLQNERENIKATILARTKQRLRIMHCANYALDRIRKMYMEAVAIFIKTNKVYRPDHSTPDCFFETAPELDVNGNSFNSLKP